VSVVVVHAVSDEKLWSMMLLEPQFASARAALLALANRVHEHPGDRLVIEEFITNPLKWDRRSRSSSTSSTRRLDDLDQSDAAAATTSNFALVWFGLGDLSCADDTTLDVVESASRCCLGGGGARDRSSAQGKDDQKHHTYAASAAYPAFGHHDDVPRTSTTGDDEEESDVEMKTPRVNIC
jgi:hypothetical protein